MCWIDFRDRHGSTLVELVISLAIIGILITITVPIFNTYIQVKG